MTKIAGLIIAAMSASGENPVNTFDNNTTAEALAAASLMKMSGKVITFPLGSPRMEEIPSMIALTKQGEVTDESQNWAQVVDMIEWVKTYKKFYSLTTMMDFLLHLAEKTLMLPEAFITGLKEVKLFTEIQDDWTMVELLTALNNTIPFISADRDVYGVIAEVVNATILGAKKFYGVGDTTFGVVILDNQDVLSFEAAKKFATENNLIIVTYTREMNARAVVILPGNAHFAEEFQNQTGLQTIVWDSVTVFVDTTGKIAEPSVIIGYVANTIGQLANGDVEYTLVRTPEEVQNLFKAVTTSTTRKAVEEVTV